MIDTTKDKLNLLPILKDGEPESGLLGDQLIPCPRDIYRPEIKAI